jgi:hypothetical protein
MAGKKEISAPWRQTSVLIRADIFEQASGQKIDISDECNRALAERLGIDYRQQKIPAGYVVEPVIIAPNDAPALPQHVPPEPGGPQRAAIINADDPHAAKAVKTRNLPKEKPATELPAAVSARAPVPAPEKPAVPSSVVPTPKKARKSAPPRKKKEDPAKKFFASMIIRDDAEGVTIAKDEMYHTFERWCRDHRILTIPDKKSFAVTLKNQFAVKEGMVEGLPTWAGVRVKG